MYIIFRNASLDDVHHPNKLINHTQLIKRSRVWKSMHEYRHRQAHMSNRSYRSPKGHCLSGWHHRGHRKGQGPGFGVKRCRWTGLARHCSERSFEAVATAVAHPVNAPFEIFIFMFCLREGLVVVLFRHVPLYVISFQAEFPYSTAFHSFVF